MESTEVKFEVGDAVAGLIQKSWRGVIVEGLNSNGCYPVLWDSETFTAHEKPENIRKLTKLEKALR